MTLKIIILSHFKLYIFLKFVKKEIWWLENRKNVVPSASVSFWHLLCQNFDLATSRFPADVSS